MSDHTSDSEGTPRAVAGFDRAGRALQPELAFVVQLRGDVAMCPRALHGRVEHVTSGEVLRFDSTEELIEFLARRGGASR
jgi:hypothetical protein